MSIGSFAISLNRAGPVIDYTSLDFYGIQSDLTVFAQANYTDRWTDFRIDQFAVVFRDMLAYSGDLLTFYLNATAREICTQTAQRRQNFIRGAKSFDYRLRGASGSSGSLQIVTDPDFFPITIPATWKAASDSWTFQADQAYTLTASNGVDNGDGTYTHTITVEQGLQYIVTLGTSDGTREQVFALPNGPLLEDTLTVTVNGSAWDEVTSFTSSDPSSQHYRVETDDDDDTYVFFGDGVNGKIPPANQIVAGTWKTGGGRATNVDADTITTLVTPVDGVISCTNPLRMEGGDEKQTLASARAELPKSLSARNSATKLEDFSTLAFEASTSVAKAKAVVMSDFTVRIAIAPAGGGQPADSLLSTVAAYVGSRRLVCRRLRVEGVTYAPCSVSLDAFVATTADRQVLQQALEDLFITTDPLLPQDGLFDFNNQGFEGRDDNGEPLLGLDRVYKELDRFKILGLQSADLRLFTNKPLFRATGYLQGTGTLQSFTTTEVGRRKQRQWRIVFTSDSTYAVYERIVGYSTSLTSTQLLDDRSPFPAVWSAASVLNPNMEQGSTFPVDLASSSSGAATINRSLSPSTLLQVGARGSRYYVESPASPSTGAVGESYAPTDHGIAWTIAAGSTPFSPGDEYTIFVNAGLGNLIVQPDEIPSLAAEDLTVTLRSAR